MLYSPEYAQLDVYTLLLFQNTHCLFSNVRDLLNSGKTFGEMGEIASKWSATEQSELWQRLTAVAHERKHFHDLLLTLDGNWLICQSFNYSLIAWCAGRQYLEDAQGTIELPLAPADELLEEVLSIKQDFGIQYRSLEYVLEASAVLAQIQFAWTWFGEEAADQIASALGGNRVYTEVVFAFARAAERGGHQIGELVHQAIISTLFLTSEDFKEQQRADTLRALAQTAREGDWSQVEQFCEQMWPAVQERLNKANALNEAAFLNLESAASRWLPPSEAEIFINAFTDFMQISKSFRATFASDPASFLRLDRYVFYNTPWVEPLAYLFFTDDLYAPTSSCDAPDDLVWDKQIASGVWKRRMEPAQMATSAPTPDRRTWTSYAKTFGGSIALFEKGQRRHLRGYWLSLMEERYGVRFVNRL